jgi:hypothetical protein
VLQPELALLLGHLAPAEQQLNHVWEGTTSFTLTMFPHNDISPKKQ